MRRITIYCTIFYFYLFILNPFAPPALAQTEEIADLDPLGHSRPQLFTSYQNDLYFFAGLSDLAIPSFVTWHVWRLQNGNTAKLPSPEECTPWRPPKEFVRFEGNLYFLSYAFNNSGLFLCRTDGQAVTMVTQVTPNSISAVPRPELELFNDGLYFAKYAGDTGMELWRLQNDALTLITDLNPGASWGLSRYAEFGVYNNHLYFRGYTPSSGWELWRTDGTIAEQVTELRPGSEDGVLGDEQAFMVFDNQLYFRHKSRVYSYQWLRTDGTTTEFLPLHNQYTYTVNTHLVTFNGSAYFGGTFDGYNNLYRIRGGIIEYVASVNPDFSRSTALFQNKLVFAGSNEFGKEVWATDGTTTAQLFDLHSAGSSSPAGFTRFQDALYFSAEVFPYYRKLLRFDGADVRLVSNSAGSPEFITAYNDHLYFNADGDGGIELWESDGLPDNTLPLPPYFSLINTSPFPDLVYADADWGDYDNDGDLDYLVIGDDGADSRTLLYRNDGDGNFTYVYQLIGYAEGSVEWADFNNDGDLDILVSGRRTNQEVGGHIYENYSGILFPIHSWTLPGTASEGTGRYLSRVSDVDLDGDLDFMTFGEGPPMLYRNDPDGRFDITFTPLDTGLPAYRKGDLQWGDYDNDGFPDLALVGRDKQGQGNTRLYRNVNGTDFEYNPLPLEGVFEGSIGWSDYDQDGDLDLFVCGQSSANAILGNLYINDTYTFSSYPHYVPFIGRLCSFDFGDYDNDGDPDVLFTGDTSLNGAFPRTFIFTYDAPLFKPVERLDGMVNGVGSWVDFDLDGDLDIALTGGTTLYASPSSFLYENQSPFGANQAPSPPGTLYASVTGHEVTLSWQPGSDVEGGISYNVRIGSHTDWFDVVAPMSAFSASGAGKSQAVDFGFRKIMRPGNAGPSTSKRIRYLAPGTYYWSVQTIDGHYQGSAFSEEQSFTITTPLPAPKLSAKVFPGGAYDVESGVLRMNLTLDAVLPLSQPFGDAPFPYQYDGDESVPGTLADITDWVLVQLRTSPAVEDIITQRPAFIKNGFTADMDQTSPLAFPGLAYRPYYVVIYHRNHLPVMSKQPVSLGADVASYDFTTGQDQAYGTNPLWELESGIYGMYGGDGNSDGTVSAMDMLQVWLPENGSVGYLAGDFNLNGSVSAFDVLLVWLAGNGLATQVP